MIRTTGTQARAMASIYETAHSTIAASAAVNGTKGFLPLELP
jgi:hypothetical protein